MANDNKFAGFVMCAVMAMAMATMMIETGSAQTVNHVVGDNVGWTVPHAPFTYAAWASSKTFMVGDTLEFNFLTNQHDVVRVPQPSYDACTQENAMSDVISTGPAKIALNATGEYRFICTIGSHCQGGQKLAINVVASTPGATRPPSPSGIALPPTSTPTDACPPPESLSPTTTVSAPPPSNSPSTSPAAAGLLLALLSGAAALLL